MIETRQGAVVVVSGDSGSGKSALLRQAAGSLACLETPPTMLGGRLVPSDEAGAASYLPWDSGGGFIASPRAVEAVDQLISLGGTVVPLLGLVAQLLSVTAATWAALDQPKSDPEIHAELLPRLLRHAARAGPHVVFVDDADLGGGVIWRALLFGLAAQIARDLPLLLVVSIRDDHAGPDLESSAQHGARLLTEQGLGEIIHLGPYTQAEVADWLGPASRELVTHLTDASAGRADVLGGLWQEWLDAGAVGRAPQDGRWDFTALDESYVIAPITGSLLNDLEHFAGSDLRSLDEYQTMLGYAALEGRSFTAEVIAHAMERDAQWVVALLEPMTDQATLGSVVVEKLASEKALAGGPRPVHRYRFPSLLHWLCMFRYGFSNPMRSGAAARVADGLKRAYSPALWLVAQQLARLSSEAGRAEQAHRYQRLADFGGLPDVILEQVAFLVAQSGAVAADSWEIERAGEAILDIIREPPMELTASTELSLSEEAYRLGEFGEIPALQIHSLIPMAHAELTLERREAAQSHFEQSLALADAHSHHVCSGRSLLGLGYVAEDAGELEQASTLYLRALAQARAHGVPHVPQECHEALMRLRYREHAIEAARAEADAWFKLAEGRLSSPHTISMACVAMLILFDSGSPDIVHGLYQQMLELRSGHDELFHSKQCGLLSVVAERLGDVSRERELVLLAVQRALPGPQQPETEALLRRFEERQHRNVWSAGKSGSGTSTAKSVRFSM
jgi:tetratricopeptide (TPR) repeat protein